MDELLELVKMEGKKNNYLRSAFDDGGFPSEGVVRDIGCEQLFRLARDSVEFRTRLSLDLLASNERLVALMESYVSVAQENNVKHPNVAHFAEMVGNYRDSSEEIKEYLAKIVMHEYESSW